MRDELIELLESKGKEDTGNVSFKRKVTFEELNKIGKHISEFGITKYYIMRNAKISMVKYPKDDRVFRIAFVFDIRREHHDIMYMGNTLKYMRAEKDETTKS